MHERPVIIIDSREQVPLPFNDDVQTERGTLYSGDYSVKGMEHLFSVEKKDIIDLCGSLTTGRDRFERELHRLRGYQFKRLLIVGNMDDIINQRYRSKANPKSILHSLNAFEMRYQIPVVWGGNGEASAKLVAKWGFWFHRELLKIVAKM